MCRILAYLGEPLPARNLLFDTDNSLVRQSYSPRMMNTFLNLAGFGMKAWDPTSLRPEEPFSYRATTLPSFDRNLRLPLVQARADLPGRPRPRGHLLRRGRRRRHEPAPVPVPRRPRRARAQRAPAPVPGMRYALVEHVRPELAQRIEGTTDSEWIYALVLSQLDDPFGVPETRELADATAARFGSCASVRAARHRHLLAGQPAASAPAAPWSPPASRSTTAGTRPRTRCSRPTSRS